MIKLLLSKDDSLCYKLIVNDKFVKYIKNSDLPAFTSDLNIWLCDHQLSALDLSADQYHEFQFDKETLEQEFYELLLASSYKKTVKLPLELQTSPVEPNLPVSFSYRSLEDFQRYWESANGLKFALYELLSRDIIENPYIDEPNDFLQHHALIAYHPNHGTTHAIRQMLLTSNYLTCIRLYGNKESSYIAQSLTAEEVACLELAAFLFRSGRTNERGWQSDLTYGPRSAAVFRQIALDLEFNSALVDVLALCFDYHAEHSVLPQLTNQSIQETKEKVHLFTKLLKLSHESDLVRCFENYEEIKKPIEEELKKLLALHFNISSISDQFLSYAVTLCNRTGAPVTGAQFTELRNNGNRKLAVESANFPKTVLYRLIGVRPECNPGFKSPTQLWIEHEHHTQPDINSGGFLLKAHNKHGQDTAYVEGWNRKSIDLIPTEQCIDVERQYLDTHVSVYHSTTKASYALDLFCRKLAELNDGSKSIAWIRGIKSKPIGKVCESFERMKQIMSQDQALDNSEYNLWHILSCNPSLWQNADYASDESTVDYFYNNSSVTRLDFKCLINNILDQMGLLFGYELERNELYAKFQKLVTDERFGKQGVLYQYLIPHHLVDEIAYISKQNGIVDPENPSALETLVQLKTPGRGVRNQHTLQVRLFVPKLLTPEIAEQLVYKNYLNLAAHLREEFEKTVDDLSVMAVKGPTKGIVEKKVADEIRHSSKFFIPFVKVDRDLSKFVEKKEAVSKFDEDECFLFSEKGSELFLKLSTN
ncbi:hypothetical protein ELY21_03290 [Legionella sp. km535]|uniref:SidE phosphodiesterase domain-containing protein n=1 Tax=Legionella sp. km535 TaxID=2498107 RepID=UPI000F8EEC3A|nr:SidE phosphodiesterase domain-containing protein [Legionella sp. km535]RUR19635.1 hypothetical protein ELY21_03290 [Legionella sp. km535]